MQDKEIIELFFLRDEDAAAALQKQYGAKLYGIARGILGSKEDAEECVNDALLKCWNSIPPENPDCLFAYASKIVRNEALLKLRSDSAQKRKCTSSVCVDELSEVLTDNGDVSETVEAEELSHLINLFLSSCKDDERDVFILRYYNFMKVSEISHRYGYTQSRVKMMLKRCREKLAEYLERNGYKI